MIKTFIIVIFTVLSNIKSYGQLKLNDLRIIRLGTLISESDYVRNLFKKEPSLQKGDFLNTYRINYDNVAFDYYGNADYTFNYIKDTLSEIRIEFQFSKSEFAQLERFLKLLVSDIKKDNNKKALSKYNTLDFENVVSIAKKKCQGYSSGEEYDRKRNEIEAEHFGSSYWSVGNTLFGDRRFLKVEMAMPKGQFIGTNSTLNSWQNSERYYGNWITVTISISNESLQDLCALLDDQATMRWSGINYMEWEKSIRQTNAKRINLKDVDGVYSIPVKINNVLTLDFVLDLGASDVSISPDVFLVLLKTGTIDDNDFVGNKSYQLADGTVIKSDVVNIKMLTIGGINIENVTASIAKSINAPLLLGQSALKKLGSYRIDNDKKLLIID